MIAALFCKAKRAPGGGIDNAKKRRKASSGRGAYNAASKGLDLVLAAVNCFGDNSKTLDCLFMNVNHVSHVDPTLDRCRLALEWLYGVDTYRFHRSGAAMNKGAKHMAIQNFTCLARPLPCTCCVAWRRSRT